MNTLKDLTARVLAFRDARNWKQFHNAKDAAISLTLEASELLELFQWRNGTEVAQVQQEKKEALSDELADVLYWVLLLANDSGIEMSEALCKKLEKNESKYPLDKACGKKEKYSELE